jgi:dephospho-CoA kinase
MKIIGLTGGIGSGKTTVAKMFSTLGVPVYFADIEAKKIMHNSIEVKNKLIAEFGVDVYLNGVLNKEYLAKIIFNNKDRLSSVNNIVHPAVESDFKLWAAKQEVPFMIQENALIFENKKQNSFDGIITVIAPIQDRIQRVMDRDELTREQILARMSTQLEDGFKAENSTFVIRNLDLKNTEIQVREIFDKLLLYSKN